MTIITLNGKGKAKVILQQNNTEFETEVLVNVIAEVKGRWVDNIYGLEPHLAYGDYDFDITPNDITEYEILDEEYEDATILKFLSIDKISFEISDTEPDENPLEEDYSLTKRLGSIIKKAST